eukprot:1058747-Rhodomonas_salina.1
MALRQGSTRPVSSRRSSCCKMPGADIGLGLPGDCIGIECPNSADLVHALAKSTQIRSFHSQKRDEEGNSDSTEEDGGSGIRNAKDEEENRRSTVAFPQHYSDALCNALLQLQTPE